MLLLLGAGCGGPAEPVSLDLAGVKPAVDYQPLATVLAAAVNSEGLVIPKALNEQRPALQTQLRLLAVTGPTASPELFPTEADRLAYWYNARAAWSMWLLDSCDCPDKLRPRDVSRPFPLDGRTMTLDQIDELLRRQDDWRVLAGAPGVSYDRARLPDKPLTGQTFDACLAGRIEQLIADPKRLEIDIDRKAVRLSPILWSLRPRIVSQYEGLYGGQGVNVLTALGPHAGQAGARRLRDAIGYKVVASVSRHLPTAVVTDKLLR